MGVLKLLRTSNIMAKKKIPGIKGQGNRALYDAMAAKRSSNAAQPHDSRPNRIRTRATAKNEAIKRSFD